MKWKIICYNGEIWEAKITMLLSEALTVFKRETGLTELDIKQVINLS
ncbi:MAG: hypothetical protein ACOC1K_01265 [Nanoarchaeota archaeon]